MCCVHPWPLLQQPVRSGAEGDVIRPHEGITRSGELDQEPYDFLSRPRGSPSGASTERGSRPRDRAGRGARRRRGGVGTSLWAGAEAMAAAMAAHRSEGVAAPNTSNRFHCSTARRMCRAETHRSRDQGLVARAARWVDDSLALTRCLGGGVHHHAPGMDEWAPPFPWSISSSSGGPPWTSSF
jgi:hypothetical protein